MNLALRAAAAAALVGALALPMSASAHRQWIMPSSTVVSGADAWVTVDAVVSNELFHPDHRPMQLAGVLVTGPDGAKVDIANGNTGQFRSTFDVHLTKPGTYKIATVNDGLNARFKVGGEQKMWRGKTGETPVIPPGATDITVSQTSSRNETFVTLGAPNTTALKPAGAGLELAAITNPTDLVSGEAAQFKFLLDGKPAADLEVIILPGASRYRAASGEIKVKTGADGAFTATFPEAGMWWINASVRDAPSTVAGAKRSANYTAVVEVLRP